MLNPATPFSSTVRDYAWTVRRILTNVLSNCLDSGHAKHIKYLDRDEPDDGRDECSLLCLLGGLLVANQKSLGICAIDYRGNVPNPNPNTPGLIVDDVSCLEQHRINLPI